MPPAIEITTARLANPEQCELGEGPIWDPIRRRVHWLDIRRGTFYSGRLQDDGTITLDDRVSLDGTIGAAAVATSGRVLLARNHRLARLGANGVAQDDPPIIASDPGRRLNDGKPDPAGRFVVGSLRLDGPSASEELIRVEDDGSTTVIDADLTLSNGLAWTRDGAVMYSIDTMRQTVFARDYDAAIGRVGPRVEFLRITEGYPDGMCLDEEEHLWIAMWGLGQVHRYSPTGELVGVIDVPAPHTSSVAFVGDDLATLVITTATQDLSPQQLEEFPHSGRLFTAVPGVRGLPQPLWNDRPTISDQDEELA